MITTPADDVLPDLVTSGVTAGWFVDLSAAFLSIILRERSLWPASAR